jgi:hypothetical protein
MGLALLVELNKVTLVTMDLPWAVLVMSWSPVPSGGLPGSIELWEPCTSWRGAGD